MLSGVTSIAEAVITCGKQEFALRGHCDNRVIDPHADHFARTNIRVGNFNALMHLKASSGDSNLIAHLEVNLEIA